MLPGRLDLSPATGQQIDDKQHDRNYQNDVNETAKQMETQSQKPENEQDDNDCPE
jgi:hypothetical protein